MGKEKYTNIPTKVIDLLNDVKNGKTGLPDLQRPFVWGDNKVRDLLDSMLKGYPIGYVMLWSTPQSFSKTAHIGQENKIYAMPEDLVIDGQQRLTSLLSALYGIKVKDKDYKEKNIRICYNPLTREFAVWTSSYANNPEWIDCVSDVFDVNSNRSLSRYRRKYIKELNEARQKRGQSILTEDDEELIETNIGDLLDLSTYLLPTLKINANATEEDVAEIFVRVNSGGQKLNEKNFIETLLAVYDVEAHKHIRYFCEQSTIPCNGTSYNPIIKLDPSHLIRMAVGYGFKRARLQYAYKLMRGKDLKTGEISAQTRDENLKVFKDALAVVTNLNNWHGYINLFAGAGYYTKDFIAAPNCVVFSYILYLLGKNEYKLKTVELNKIMKKWIYMATITSYFSQSTESTVEKIFADLRSVNTADDYIMYLNKAIAEKFTDDYFNITLPKELEVSSAIAPEWYGYIAALNVLGTPMLFSTAPLSQFLVAGASGTKNAIDKHHIFPKAYLTSVGIQEDRDRNQVANFTYLDYSTNIDISDNPPSEYVHKYRAQLGEEQYQKTCQENALPFGFDNMDYFDFLAARRCLMAEIVKKGYEALCK